MGGSSIALFDLTSHIFFPDEIVPGVHVELRNDTVDFGQMVHGDRSPLRSLLSEEVLQDNGAHHTR